MKKTTASLLIIYLILSAFHSAQAQKYQLKDSKTSFFSTTPVEDIYAETKETKGILDLTTNSFFFKIPIKSFEFKSGLMRDHFNENYMESEKFPTASFKGKIEGSYDLKKDGLYSVKAIGQMTIHGQVQEVVIPSKLSVINGIPSLEAVFKTKLVDYKIEIPTVVFNKIAEQVEVTVKSTLELVK